MNSSKHRSRDSATANLDELIFTLLIVPGCEFGISNRYAGFKTALDTTLTVTMFNTLLGIWFILEMHYEDTSKKINSWFATARICKKRPNVQNLILSFIYN